MSGRARARVAAALATVAALASAAAGAGAAGGANGAAAAGAAAGGDTVRLTVTFTRARGGPRHVAHLRCTGDRATADGYLRGVGASRACARARRISALLVAAPDRTRACTQIYGGPERALVAGRIGGRRVRRAFTRTNGCGISDWVRARPLLPRPT